MADVPIKDAKNKLNELVRRAEAGEAVTTTRSGKPVADLVPHKQKTGLNLQAIKDFKKKHGLKWIIGPVPDDFDDPLPEDVVLQPLPGPTKQSQ